MARKKQADMTLAQRQTAENDKFRKTIYAEHLEEVRVAPVNDDYDKFKRDLTREALRDAKASR